MSFSESCMRTGVEFLRDQGDDGISTHTLLRRSMTDHESTAADQRYQDLCFRHEPHMRQHQRLLEEVRATLGKVDTTPTPADVVDAVKRMAGSAFGTVRSLADAPQSDYSRLMDDLALVRQLEVSFKIFREAGRQLGIEPLARLGEIAERHHDEYSAEVRHHDEYSAEAKRLLT